MPFPFLPPGSAQAGIVLLVEDEASIREMLSEVLQAYGFVIVEAPNADDAWTYLQDGGRADAVFSDVAMPGSMNGLELVRRIRETYPAIPTVVTSGHGAPPRGFDVGTFLAKPFRLEAVARLLRGVIASPAV